MRSLLGLFLVFVYQNSVFASGADDILGIWYADGGKSKVEVYHCKNKYCGKIVWLKEPKYPLNDSGGMAGLIKVDRDNPDKSKRTRPIIGLDLVSGFSFDTVEASDEEEDPFDLTKIIELSWSGGEIYDPRNGKTYNCTMMLANVKTLNVRGYVGIPLFGRSVTWKR